NELPWKFEAGTPNIEGVIGLGAALSYLDALGMKSVAAQTTTLTNYAQEKFREIPEVVLLGNSAPESGILAFTVEGLHPHDIAELLGQKHICIRAGHHCAAPLHGKLGIVASNRLSLGIYNDQKDVNTVTMALREIITDINHA